MAVWTRSQKGLIGEPCLNLGVKATYFTVGGLYLLMDLPSSPVCQPLAKGPRILWL